MRLFLDTAVLVARINPRDTRHKDALTVFRRIQGGEWSAVHTSDHVVAETLNFIQARIGRKDAAEAFLDAVFGRSDAPPVVTSVLRIHSGRFAAAVERYRKHFDAGLSLTDCSSLVVMGEERIKQIATFDAGFRAFADVVDGS
jgi:uncharacterized protein